jgi:5-methylcytosine-specific restriction enzyme subunit McrC
MSTTLELDEGGRLESLPLPHSIAAAIGSLRIATVIPARQPGEYDVSNIRKVGVVVIDGVVVRIKPKTPIQRLFAMLSYARDPDALWRDDTVGFDRDDDLYSVIAFAFANFLERALQAGPSKGYVEREEALAMVRGRWRITDQLTRRAGQPLPLEISYDDFVEDIPANRILKTAAMRILRFPLLPGPVVTKLRRSLRLLSDVTPLVPGAPLPPVTADRASKAYRGAIDLARLILANASLEHREGSKIGNGFLVDLWTVFEDFVSSAIQATAQRTDQDVRVQLKSALDRRQRVRIAPDLAWVEKGSVTACADVKYKAEHYGQFPNADIYQMAAYCTRFKLTEGHLIYAAGDAEPRRVEVINGPVIVQHTLSLNSPFAELLQQVEDLAARIAGDNSVVPRSW